MEQLERHSGGQSPYTVTQLEDIAQFDEAVQKAGKNVMAICYHNGCPTPERAWDRMEQQYPNVVFYKVNTLKS